MTTVLLVGFVLGVVTVPVVGGGSLWWWMARRRPPPDPRYAAWRRTAADVAARLGLGIHDVPGRFAVASGTLDGRAVVVEVVDAGGGWTTRVRVHTGRTDLTVAPRRGEPDGRASGDPAFDDAVRVVGDAAHLAAWLDEATRQRLAPLVASGLVHEAGAFACTTAGVAPDPAPLVVAAGRLRALAVGLAATAPAPSPPAAELVPPLPVGRPPAPSETAETAAPQVGPTMPVPPESRVVALVERPPEAVVEPPAAAPALPAAPALTVVAPSEPPPVPLAVEPPAAAPEVPVAAPVEPPPAPVEELPAAAPVEPPPAPVALEPPAAAPVEPPPAPVAVESPAAAPEPPVADAEPPPEPTATPAGAARRSRRSLTKKREAAALAKLRSADPADDGSTE